LVLGHDLYFAYVDWDEGKPESWQLSALGWLWTTYSPDSHDYMKDFFEASTWSNTIEPVLKMPAIYVTAAFSGFFLVIVGILKFMKLWPFNEEALFTGKKSGDFTFNSKKPKK
jgi:hypothetical protein